MEVEPYVSLREGLHVAVDGSSVTVHDESGARFLMQALNAHFAAAIRTLDGVGAPLAALVAIVGEGLTELAYLHYNLARMTKARLLRYSLVVDHKPLLHIEEMAEGTFAPVPVPAGSRFQLSRFACLRTENARMMIESAISAKRGLVTSPIGGAILTCLAVPRTIEELHNELPADWRHAAQPMLSYLLGAGFAADATDEENPVLAQWEFHDLLFHSRSRLGRHDYPSGAAFPFTHSIKPLPARGHAGLDRPIALPKPDIASLRVTDRPFADVMETRRSLRKNGSAPITVNELGEFLFRVARIKEIFSPPGAGDPFAYETSSRPYPSGGACYDLEIYICVNTCTGLTEGYYHYDPLRHGLCLLPDQAADRRQLLNDAIASALLSAPPQVLVVITSRFQRISWKYRSMAYATTLKNVGVLYATMQFTATAMGLASCPLGNGNASLGAKAGGSDYFAESSVGEFILGTRDER